MSLPISTEFKITLLVVVLVMAGVSVKLISEAGKIEPRTEIINDEVHATYDIEFARAGGESLRLDVYEPMGWSLGLRRPAILMIHGGAWIEGDKSSERDLATVVVPHGFVAFAINYRLTHEGRSLYPAALRDVRRAARWVRAHAGEYGVDPNRIGAVGWSAGGHLACILGTTDEPDPDDPDSTDFSSRVNCVVDTAGPTDFTDPSSPALGVGMERVLPTFLGGPLGSIPQTYRDASPIAHIDSRTAPTLILHGTADTVVPVDQSRRFAAALKAAGADVRYVEIPNAHHGFDQPANHERWLTEITSFLISHLKP